MPFKDMYVFYPSSPPISKLWQSLRSYILLLLGNTDPGLHFKMNILLSDVTVNSRTTLRYDVTITLFLW